MLRLLLLLYCAGSLFLATSGNADPLAVSIKVSMSIKGKSVLPQIAGKPPQFGSLELVGFEIDLEAPNGYYDPMSFRLQTPTDNSPYAKPANDNITIHLVSQEQSSFPPEEFKISYWASGGSSLRLLLKIPTDRNDRIARARAAIEKDPEFQKHQPDTSGRYSVDKLSAGVADYVVDSKVGTYTLSASFRDPKTGVKYTSNTIQFTIVDQGYPPPSR